jgi:hypothetical protein
MQQAMLAAFGRLAFVTCIVPSLTACAPMLAIVGYSQSAIQFAAQVDKIKLIGDGVSYVRSGKTITDRALSLAAGEDCRIFNVVSRAPVCSPKHPDAADAGVTDEPVRLAVVTGD